MATSHRYFIFVRVSSDRGSSKIRFLAPQSQAIRPNACPLFLSFFWRNSTPVGQVSRSHSTTNPRRYALDEWVIVPLQRPLPDNTQHSQQTDIHDPGGIRTHNISRRATVDLRLRPRGHWDRLCLPLPNVIRLERHRGRSQNRFTANQLKGSQNRTIKPFHRRSFVLGVSSYATLNSTNLATVGKRQMRMA